MINELTKGLINVEIPTLWLAIWPPRSRSGWKAVLKATASSADAVDARSCVAPWWLDSGWLSGQLAWLESDSQSHRAHWASEGPWTCSQAHAQGRTLLLLDTATRHGLECGVESPIVLSHLAKIYQLLLDARRLYILDVH